MLLWVRGCARVCVPATVEVPALKIQQYEEPVPVEFLVFTSLHSLTLHFYLYTYIHYMHCTHACNYSASHTYMDVCMHGTHGMQAHSCTHAYKHARAHVGVCAHVRTHAYMHAWTRTRAHTHARTYTQYEQSYHTMQTYLTYNHTMTHHITSMKIRTHMCVCTYVRMYARSNVRTDISYPIISYPIISYPINSYHIISYHAISCHNL